MKTAFVVLALVAALALPARAQTADTTTTPAATPTPALVSPVPLPSGTLATEDGGRVAFQYGPTCAMSALQAFRNTEGGLSWTGAKTFGVGMQLTLSIWPYGVLANHIWSFAGWGPQNVNSTYIQPFLSYTTKTYTTPSINTESTYNWQSGQWTVPINVGIQQLVKIGKMPIAFQIGYRYYAQRPAYGPDWGLRFAVTFLFPK